VEGLLAPDTRPGPDQRRGRAEGSEHCSQPDGLAGHYAAVDEALTGRKNLVMIGQLYQLGTVI
jgi:hypothetical protein